MPQCLSSAAVRKFGALFALDGRLENVARGRAASVHVHVGLECANVPKLGLPWPFPRLKWLSDATMSPLPLCAACRSSYGFPMLLLAEFIVIIVGVAVLVCYFFPVGASALAQSGSRNVAPIALRTKRSAFKAYRLTDSTFLIVEVNDIYSEHPYIYAKLVPAANTILVLDTGCGGASNDRDVEITSLREFIETVGVEDNGGKPLNERGRMRYVVALSHCHYDHILGVEDFAKDSPILESSYSPSFVSRANLPTHSLCSNLGIRTPVFTPTLVPHNRPVLSAFGTPVGMTVLHTPGHTPDEIAMWDADDLMLYVGDTVYEFEPIIFPNEGDIRIWLSTIDKLVAVVMSSTSPAEVMINSGHRTTMRPALEVLRTAKQFMVDVLLGKEKVRSRTRRRGLDYVEYVQDGGRYSLQCPERLIREARDIV